MNTGRWHTLSVPTRRKPLSRPKPASKGPAGFPYYFAGKPSDIWRNAIEESWRRRWQMLRRGAYRPAYFLEDQFVYVRLAASRSLAAAIKLGLRWPSFSAEFRKLLSITVRLPRRWNRYSRLHPQQQAQALQELASLLRRFVEKVEKNERLQAPEETAFAIEWQKIASNELLLNILGNAPLRNRQHPRARDPKTDADRMSLFDLRWSLEPGEFEHLYALAQKAIQALSQEANLFSYMPVIVSDPSPGRSLWTFAVYTLEDQLADFVSKLPKGHTFPLNRIICELANSAFVTCYPEDIDKAIPILNQEKYARLGDAKGNTARPIQPLTVKNVEVMRARRKLVARAAPLKSIPRISDL